MPSEERVLCFQRKLLDEIGAFQGLEQSVEKYLSVITAPANLTYLNRIDAEQNKSFKQLIPYILIHYKGKILRYRRGKGGQETRLHGLLSVGIGGHISEEDHGLFNSENRGYYHEGMRRELMEEVNIDAENAPAVALINDDSTEVGYVHFGVVHVLQVGDESIVKYKRGILGPEFVPLAEAVKNLNVYESWSRLCLAQLDLLLNKATHACDPPMARAAARAHAKR